MKVSREQLYEQVWSEPMVAIAARYDVSSSYMARVCECLNVSRPSRGYWAKLEFGQRPKRPALPPARPGDDTEWSPGRSPGAYALRRPHRPGRPGKDKPADNPKDKPHRHGLLIDLEEYYLTGRVSKEGYLRPLKRVLPDIYVSKDTLRRALDNANQLFLKLEKAGHRVTLATGPVHRPDLDQREKPGSHQLWETWRPARPTVVAMSDITFTLTFYEISTAVDVQYVDGKWVRVDSLSGRRHSSLEASWTTKQDLPSGRLALRACASDWRAKWEMHWREDKPGQLSSKLFSIRRELEAAIPVIRERIEEAKKEAEIQRQRWEAERRELRRRERAERRAAAIKDSRAQLLNIIDEWALARRIETFFEDISKRQQGDPTESQSELDARLALARALLGGTDALQRFQSWKAPEEREPTAFEEDLD